MSAARVRRRLMAHERAKYREAKLTGLHAFMRPGHMKRFGQAQVRLSRRSAIAMVWTLFDDVERASRRPPP